MRMDTPGERHLGPNGAVLDITIDKKVSMVETVIWPDDLIEVSRWIRPEAFFLTATLS